MTKYRDLEINLRRPRIGASPSARPESGSIELSSTEPARQSFEVKRPILRPGSFHDYRDDAMVGWQLLRNLDPAQS